MSYLGLSFFGREDGALVVDDTPVNSARCAIELYTTTDGGASWSGPVVARKGTGVCLNNVAGAPPIAVGPNRFWIEEDDRLLTGRLEASNAGARFEALPSAGPLCSLGTDGAMLWAVSGSDCQALFGSDDGGSHWVRDLGLPLASIEGPLSFEGASTVLAVGAPAGADLAAEPAGPLAVARSDDGGRTWSATRLPCPVGAQIAWWRGYVAGSGRDLAAVCGDGMSAGAEALEIAYSSNGGRRWSETCGDGAFGANELGSECPATYAEGLAVLGQHEIVMAFGYASSIGVSSDGGATWQLGTAGLKVHGLPFIAFSAFNGYAWVLQFGPEIGPGGQDLGWSSTGTSWHEVNLPALRP
ncbi:MAG TPA: sialidase family protein [Acidimicrobiales bacterium]|nr:sialidase family protein [Acidimicrobiales bacterium]